jgi:hypothetical protein
MKKITILFVAVIAMFATSANAQEKGEMYVGGTLGFSIASVGANGHMATGGSFNVTPEFGYFVADNLKIGAELTYGISGGTHTMLLMPNVAYYLRIVDKLYYTPQLSLGGGFAADSGYSAGAFAVSLHLASLEFKPVENMGISVGLVDLNYTRVSKSNGVGFNFLTSPSVGFRFYF